MNDPYVALILAVFFATSAIFLWILFLLFRKPRPSAVESMLLPLLESLKEIPVLKSQVERLAQEQPRFQDKLTSLEQALTGVQTKLEETSGSVKQSLMKDIQGVKSVIDGLKAEYEARKKEEEEIRRATQRIESVLAGSRSRGESGENILAEALKQLPPGMVEYDFRVDNKPVEFALVLPNKRRLPIDSKWTASSLLETLSEEPDPEKRKKIDEAIEKEVLKKVKEVVKYIDPATTTPSAIAAIPDSAYSACKKAHIEAFREGVLLMPYSLTIPYVLTLYKLHLQYSRSVDVERLESYLSQMERSTEEMEKTLENSVARSAIMVSNAYNEMKRLMADIRASLVTLRSLPASEFSQTSLPAGESVSPAPTPTEHHLFPE